VRWWRLFLGGALLAWVLVAAYRRARARHRELGFAVLLLEAAVIMFLASAFAPRPPVTIEIAAVLLVGSLATLAGAIAVVLWKGFGG
jgi:hypothetical protein